MQEKSKENAFQASGQAGEYRGMHEKRRTKMRLHDGTDLDDYIGMMDVEEEKVEDYDFSKFDATGEKLKNYALLSGAIAVILGLMMVL